MAAPTSAQEGPLFGPSTSYPVDIGGAAVLPDGITVADFDDDGGVDAAVGDGSWAAVLLNDGVGALTQQEDFTLGHDGGGFDKRFVSADLDSDGLPDLATFDAPSDEVHAALNDGDGTFGEPTVAPAGEGPLGIASADFDGDGNVDVVTANVVDESVSVLLGDGEGGFGDPIEFAVEGEWPHRVVSGDLDGDGQVDLATANENSDDVSVLLNNSEAGEDRVAFADPDTYALATSPRDMTAADIDDDGALDLLTANPSSDSVSVLSNDADGTFGPATEYPVGDGTAPNAVTAADFDGDGAVDAATANPGTDEVAVLLGDGEGGLEAPVAFGVDEDPRGVAHADFDGNGSVDLASVNDTGESVSVLLNNQGPASMSVGLSPQEASNAVGEEHTVTATTTDGEGNPVADVDVEFRVSGSHSASGTATTDSEGEATFSYTGQTGGEDEITAFVDSDGDGAHDAGEPVTTAAKTWHAPPSVSVEATDQAGEPDDDGAFTFTRAGGDLSTELTATYTVSGTATAGQDYVQLGGEVSFAAESETATVPVEVIDDDEVEDDETVTATVEDGEAYDVGEPAEATVTIADDDTADDGGTGGDGGTGDDGDGDEAAAEPASLGLSPQEATNQVGEEHAVTATVADADGTAVSDVSVEFAVSGAHTASGSAATDTDGEASFAYTGETAGDDTITAFADTDGDGAQDDGEPADMAAKTWETVEDGEDDEAEAAAAQVTGSDGPTAACGESFVPAAGFGDVAGSVHESAIDCVAWYAITLGVGDVDGDGQDDYAPSRPVTRDQMASFLARLADEAGLQAADAADAFGDDDGSVHEANINTLAALGVTEGKGDIDGDGQAEYAPREPVTRDQMASFLARLADQAGLDVPDDAPDAFGDDDGSVHEGNINALAALGISQGKGDVDGDGVDEYAPRQPVNRAQMASFIARELGLLADVGIAEPGGANVDLAEQSTEAGELSGTVVANKPVAEVVADGCGLAGQALDVAGDGSFTVSIPDDQPAGDCELTVTVTTERPGVDTGGQTVPYTFDVTVSG